MVRLFDNSYRNYRADQRDRPNDFKGWKVHDKFGRPMGTLGEYLEKQGNFKYDYDPHVTGNDQFEDSFGKFDITHPGSGDDLYMTIKCLLYGIAKGYFRRYPTEQTINWKMCTKITLLSMDNEEISMQDLVGENRDRFYLSHLDLAFRVAVAK